MQTVRYVTADGMYYLMTLHAVPGGYGEFVVRCGPTLSERSFCSNALSIVPHRFRCGLIFISGPNHRP